MKKILFFILCLFLFTGCSVDPITLDLNDLVVIYTNAQKEKSNLLIMDKQHKQKFEAPLKKVGIFNIIADNNNNLILPVQYSNEILKIQTDLEKKIKEEQTLPYPLFYEKVRGKEFIVYNYDKKQDINYCTYEIRGKNNSKKIRFRGLPRALAVDSTKAYMYVDDGHKHYLYMVNLKNGNILSTIPLTKGGSAGDIKKINNKLLITTLTDSNQQKPDSYLISILLDRSNRVVYKKLTNIAPNKILYNEKNIFISHWNNNIITVLDKKTLDEKDTIKLKGPILDVELVKNKFYSLRQENNGGIIDIYNINDWNKVDNIVLPQKKDLLVQDFHIVTTSGNK